MDRKLKQKISKEIKTQQHYKLTRYYRHVWNIPPSYIVEYTFILYAPGTFSRIDYMLLLKTRLSTFKSIEIIYKYVLLPKKNEIRNQ